MGRGERFVISVAFVLAVSIILLFQFVHPLLWGVDPYYHIRLAQFYKDYGFGWQFKWAQFSTFRPAFGDKDLLLHLATVPFLRLPFGEIVCGKIAAVSFAILSFILFFIILRRVSHPSLLWFFILALPLSNLWLGYANYLRPMTFTNMLLLLLIYFAIEEKWFIVFLLSILYPLTHVSYLITIPLVCGIEFFRWLYTGRKNLRNIAYSVLGLGFGVFLHPDFPNNMLVTYLNAILVPLGTMFGVVKLNFGQEFNPLNTRSVFLDFLPFWTGFIALLGILAVGRVRMNLRTRLFTVPVIIFLVLSMFSLRYWYHLYPLGLVWLASFYSDFIEDKQFRRQLFIVAGIIIIFCSSKNILSGLKEQNLNGELERDFHYKRMGEWARVHIPPNQIVFHTTWSDSPFFIFYNPKDYYLVVLDPIYMYFFNKDVYNAYSATGMGFVKEPWRMIKEGFKATYGYTPKGAPLYKQIKSDKEHFKVLYDDDMGVIFEVLWIPEEDENNKETKDTGKME